MLTHVRDQLVRIMNELEELACQLEEVMDATPQDEPESESEELPKGDQGLQEESGE